MLYTISYEFMGSSFPFKTRCKKYKINHSIVGNEKRPKQPMFCCSDCYFHNF